jgi:flagellar basal-body rod protein FlgB
MHLMGEALMFENIPLLRTSGMMAKHAGAAQKNISINIANADTPNYAPRGFVSFSEALSNRGQGNLAYQTRPGHLSWNLVANSGDTKFSTPGELKPNGNSVSVEIETMKSVEIERQHSQALAIYQHSIDLLKTSLGRGR